MCHITTPIAWSHTKDFLVSTISTRAKSFTPGHYPETQISTNLGMFVSQFGPTGNQARHLQCL